jgi:hypothetical protein
MPEEKVIPNGGGLDDGSPEGHVEKMLAMGEDAPKEGEEGSVAPTGDEVTPRPDNIPEQFWDAEKGVVNTEALLKSQADGQAEINKLRAGKEPEGEGEGDQAGDSQDENQADVVNAASAEWAEKGELTAETFTALEGVGISKEMVNDYIAGQKLIVSSLQDAAYGPFEGKEGYELAADWAASVFTDEEVKALDVQLLSNNPAIVAQGAKALAARYAAEADVEPATIRGDSNNPAAGGTYASSREMMKDMNSNEYKTSEAFRQQVGKKMLRSDL